MYGIVEYVSPCEQNEWELMVTEVAISYVACIRKLKGLDLALVLSQFRNLNLSWFQGRLLIT